MKQPLIVLTGPTASGKTALSIGLAKAIGGEIISADSMQVYRQMDIGSAKIKPEEIKDIIESRDRTKAGKTLVPNGLTLMEVNYDK